MIFLVELRCFLKSRSELFFIFESFCPEIKTQFNTVIRVLRSDNAREYFSAPFTKFMSSQGIFINLLALIPHNKMGLLRVRIDILMKRLAPYFYIIRFLSAFGQMLC